MEIDMAAHATLSREVERVLQRLMDEAGSSLGRYDSLVNTLFGFLTSVDGETAKISTRLLFTSLVEPLLDSFTAEGRNTYYTVFSSLIQLARRAPEGRGLDESLNRFGLREKGDLLARKNRVLVSGKSSLPFEKIKKVFILSRVTIGADVAVTGIILQKAKLVFPNARLIMIGSLKMGELFSGEERVDIIPVRYRTETLFTRLYSWIDLLDAISASMNDEDSVLFDPDSRFTQLGLLPLFKPEIEPERYFFYESTVNEPVPLSFNESLNNWFDTVFYRTKRSFGTLSLSDENNRSGDEFFSSRGLEDDFVVTVNFGVGGNELKRVEGGFEGKLVSLILKSGVTLMLDEGFGPEESGRVQEIRKAFPDNPRLITFQAGIGEFASLIKRSSLYIGYDSMGQHVAAACGVPEIIIFKGYHSLLFPIRWAPSGECVVNTILAAGKSEEEILRLVEEGLDTALEKAGRKVQ